MRAYPSTYYSSRLYCFSSYCGYRRCSKCGSNLSWAYSRLLNADKDYYYHAAHLRTNETDYCNSS